jgi:hypothetical protein
VTWDQIGLESGRETLDSGVVWKESEVLAPDQEPTRRRNRGGGRVRSHCFVIMLCIVSLLEWQRSLTLTAPVFGLP